MKTDDELLKISTAGPVKKVTEKNLTGGLIHHQSVTLTARMWPPIEAEPSNIFLGLPYVVWGIIIGCGIIFLLILVSLFFYFYLLPRQQKILSQSAQVPLGVTSTSSYATNVNQFETENESNCIRPQSFFIENQVNECNNNRNPIEMASTHNTHHHHHHQPMMNDIYHRTINCSGHCVNDGSTQNIPETHKSMWAVNTFYDSNQDVNDAQSNYRTRSLPSWGKNGKQRPASTIDDLEELYAQVNFTKKRRNRMRNDNAAIIARCRSRSQNLTSLQIESEGVVVYDERTAL